MRRKNYVNNATLLEHMKEHLCALELAKQTGTLPPRISPYIGQAIYLIATRLASKPNFFGYSFKEDMIGDGIETCLMYLHNFNPNKSNNVFAYFTQIIKFAFIRRIQKEKKQHYIKIKNLEKLAIEDMVKYNELMSFELNEMTSSFINEYEQQLTQKKKDAKIGNNVSKFLRETT